MNLWQSTLISIFLLILPLFAIQAEDINRGEALHHENCLECHTPKLYERTDRTVKTLKHLRSQVLFCAVNNDIGWFSEEVDEVSTYLNAFYYLFDTE